jgi:hypothetical protein
VLETILFGIVCFAIGLVTGPLVLYGLIKIFMHLVKRRIPR